MSYTHPLIPCPTRRARYLKLTLLLLFILALNFGGSWLAHQVNFQIYPRHEGMLLGILWGTVFVYILLMALPFMPGIEIGMVLMLMLGREGVLLVYLSTLLALSLSFLIGRLIPPRGLARALNWLTLDKAAHLVSTIGKQPHPERLRILNEKMPSRFSTFLLNHRYVSVMIALNIPGNALIGGGGGIGSMVGMSQLISFPKYLLLVAIAISPLPVIIYIGP